MNSITPIKKDEIGRALPDGSLVISADELSRFGNGDPKRGRRELRLILEAEKDHTIHNAPATKPKTVRIAVPADEPALMELLLQDLRENAERIAPIDEGRVLGHIQAGTRQMGGIVGVIDGPDGKPVAVAILIPVQWWWSRAYYLQDVANYVHPDHRATRHIHDLIHFEKWITSEWSKRFGYRIYLLCGILGIHRLREKTIIFKRKFFQAGAAFLYPSPYGDE